MIKKCKICQKEFTPSKYSPKQEVCSDAECQHKRQTLNQKKWRQINPDYFKYRAKKTLWEKKRSQYLWLWRENHKKYFKNYYKNLKIKINHKQKLDFNLDIKT